MNVKKLWDYYNLYNCVNFFEVEPFHHTKEYNSWNEFINDEYALSCNCISDQPLLYWYWDNGHDDSDDSDDHISHETITQNPKEYFKRIILIYKQWQVGMGSIIINVECNDEPNIRMWIIEQQKDHIVS